MLPPMALPSPAAGLPHGLPADICGPGPRAGGPTSGSDAPPFTGPEDARSGGRICSDACEVAPFAADRMDAAAGRRLGRSSARAAASETWLKPGFLAAT